MFRVISLAVLSALYALPVWSISDEKPYISVHILSENILSTDSKGGDYISECNRDNSNSKKPESILLVNIHQHEKGSAYFGYINIHTVNNSPLSSLIVGSRDNSKEIDSLLERIYLYKESWVVFHDLSSLDQLGKFICSDYNTRFDAVVEELESIYQRGR